MFRQIYSECKKELCYYYQNPLLWFSFLINEIIILLVFWYTAKAFVPNISLFNGKTVDYFTFIVIGETFLRIPSFFITIIGRNLKNATLDGAFETHLLLGYSPEYTFLMGGMCASIFEIIKVSIVLILALIFFNIDISIISLTYSMLAQFLSIFIFLGLGLISVSILLIFRRGESWIMKLTSIATILAGAYFPTTVLPYNLGNNLLYLSPFNLLLETTRKILNNEINLSQYLMNNLILSLWAILMFSIGFFSFKKALHLHRKSDKPFTYIS